MQISKEFSNQVVLPDLLAPIEVQEFQGLEAKYKLVKQLNAAILFGVSFDWLFSYCIFLIG